MDLTWKLNRDFAISVYKEFKFNFLKEYDICLAGSVAKNTSIDNKEIDIFVKFKSKAELDNATTEIFNYIKSNFTFEIKFQTSPYIIAYYKDIKIDIVPCLTSQNEHTLIDNTLSHTKYVNKHLKNPLEVIKLKQLLKTYDIYGSNTELSGFSGYICELLIIKYETMNNLIQNHMRLISDLKYLDDPTSKTRDLMKGASEKNKLKFLAICHNIYYNKVTDCELIYSEFEKGLKIIILENIKQNLISAILKRLTHISEIMNSAYHFFTFNYCFNMIFIEYYADLNLIYKVNALPLDKVTAYNILNYFSNTEIKGIDNIAHFKRKEKTLKIDEEVNKLICNIEDIKIKKIDKNNYILEKETLEKYIHANYFR